MNYLSLFTPHNLALLSDWVTDTGELYVDINLPHSGGSSISYFIRSFQDLKDLVAQQTWPEIAITIFHRRQYPLRGVVDDGLAAKALHDIRDGEWYAIVSLGDHFPAPCAFLGGGDSHRELRQELEELTGKEVGIGKNPFDYDTTPFHFDPEVFQVAVTRNQNYYQEFADHAGKYEWIREFWQDRS